MTMQYALTLEAAVCWPRPLTVAAAPARKGWPGRGDAASAVSSAAVRCSGDRIHWKFLVTVGGRVHNGCKALNYAKCASK